jgi:hypothetical protein
MSKELQSDWSEAAERTGKVRNAIIIPARQWSDSGYSDTIVLIAIHII